MELTARILEKAEYHDFDDPDDVILEHIVQHIGIYYWRRQPCQEGHLKGIKFRTIHRGSRGTGEFTY